MDHVLWSKSHFPGLLYDGEFSKCEAPSNLPPPSIFHFTNRRGGRHAKVGVDVETGLQLARALEADNVAPRVMADDEGVGGLELRERRNAAEKS